MSQPRYKRAPAGPTRHVRHNPTGMPVVLPHLVMDVAGGETMTVTMDSTSHELAASSPTREVDLLGRVSFLVTTGHPA